MLICIPVSDHDVKVQGDTFNIVIRGECSASRCCWFTTAERDQATIARKAG